MRAFAPIFAAAVTLAGATSAGAGTGMTLVTNERGNTISVLDASHTVVETIETCARPRGIHFSADRAQFFVGCADDDQIAIYDTATRALVGRIPGSRSPRPSTCTRMAGVSTFRTRRTPPPPSST